MAVIKAAEHQLPIDILNSQRSTLEGKFWQVNVETGDNVMCTTPTEKMAEVNKALEENKNKVLERYKSCMNSSNNSKTEMVSIPLFYDASRRISYPMFNSLDECSERAKDIKKVVERFKNNPAILQALMLDFAPQYNETCQRISQSLKLQKQIRLLI